MNTPKKAKDPTEAALSAIQDALQVREDEQWGESAAARPVPTGSDETAPEASSSWPSLRSKPFAEPDPFDGELPVPGENA